ncbi:hypothetical protein GCM10022255_070150 [Dactylosporangium darangshiense]|uniref:Transposase n=1 Tax=Dactylosporangium darangshiense TaxID=579108 RepID=A0ABP8DI23_9ACTN
MSFAIEVCPRATEVCLPVTRAGEDPGENFLDVGAANHQPLPAAIRPHRMINQPTGHSRRTHPAALNLDRRRALIDTLMTVELLRAPRGRKGFDPDTLRITWRL